MCFRAILYPPISKKSPFFALVMNTLIGTDLSAARQFLEAGHPIGIPTETVYGLAANALSPAAVARIFEVKNRPTFDPLIVHVPDAEAAQIYSVHWPETARRLADAFWPGPLTLLLDKRDMVPDLVTAGLPRVGLRVPSHPLTLRLLQTLRFPLAAPSANPFGYISPTTARHVFDQLKTLIPYILDGGPCQVGVESTIIGFEDGKTVVYRLGGLSMEQLEQVAGPLTLQLHQSSNPAAPGMLTTHYAPRKSLYLGPIEELLGRFPQFRAGLLTLCPLPRKPVGALCISLSADGDLNEAAQNLFAAMRLLDESDVDVILAEPMPETGLGRAINDRLRRAAV